MSSPDPYRPPSSPVADPRPVIDAGNPAIGVGITIGLAVVMIVPMMAVGVGLSNVFGVRGESQMIWGLAPLMFFGAFQFIYVVPLALWLKKRGKTRTVSGIWITAGVLFLLNSACYGALLIK